ncbi:hypothetical protein [Lewinella sp. 4G2]|uniref:hypothetical protein n=1 Tax=Lewinella sp. 4G2 TaxID=1803372 RepID=UPI0007B4C50C|nr:hypothetical protein [Lewinella sp. 4G2]OAV42899.1 hypothetical protein A3850_016885 [Lewinella sp. 4G2]
MQRTEFDLSLKNDSSPPAGSSLAVAALWWLCNSNWEKAHDLIDREPGIDLAWIHAFLHRMEGDQANASYWYARSGRQNPGTTIGKELEQLLSYFLG